MALSKAQKAAKAQKKIDEARAFLEAAVAEGETHGITSSVPLVAAPALAGANHKNTSTVWIGCKLPRGLIIQCCEEATIDRPILGGGVKSVKVFMRTGAQIRLKGYAVPFGKVPNYTIIGGFGLTEVDRGFWERWKLQNSKLDLLTKGLIFEHGEKASVEAYANEHADLKCGLEPLNPNGDPRVDKVESDNLTDIEADTDRSKQRKAAA